jgi:hypothetical protein
MRQGNTLILCFLINIDRTFKFGKDSPLISGITCDFKPRLLSLKVSSKVAKVKVFDTTGSGFHNGTSCSSMGLSKRYNNLAQSVKSS